MHKSHKQILHTPTKNCRKKLREKLQKCVARNLQKCGRKKNLLPHTPRGMNDRRHPEAGRRENDYALKLIISRIICTAWAVDVTLDIVSERLPSVWKILSLGWRET